MIIIRKIVETNNLLWLYKMEVIKVSLENLANIATIMGLGVSIISLIISGITLKLALNIKININQDKSNNILESSVNNSTINQIKGW